MNAVHIIVLFVVGTSPLLFAAVQPWVWAVFTLLIFTAFIIVLWQEETHNLWKPKKIVIFTLITFFIVTLFQYLPIPSYLLSLLSSFRYESLSTSIRLLGDGLSWKSFSYSPLMSLSRWTFLISASMFFFVLKCFCHSRKSIKFLILIMIALAVLEAIYGLIQALIPSLGVLWVDYIQVGLGKARGTFINRNHFAGFIEMVWPLALGYAMALGYRGKEINLRKLLASDRINKQILIVLGIVVMQLALLLSRSRAGIMGAFIGFLTFMMLSRSGSKRMPIGFWVMTGAMVFLVFLYGVKIGFDPIINRFLKIGVHLGEGDSRLDIWRDSLVILKDHPLGIGLGNFKDVYPVYNVSRISDTRFLYAHNDYLQILIEAGIIGFIALVSGFIFFLVKSFYKVKQMKAHHDPLRFFLAVGALSGLVSIAFHSFFDFNLHMPANLIYFVTLMAIVHSCAWEKPARNSQRSRQSHTISNRHLSRQAHTRFNGHGPTQTHTNFVAADLAAPKMSSASENNKSSTTQRKYRSK
jgi:O-antigen ligase